MFSRFFFSVRVTQSLCEKRKEIFRQINSFVIYVVKPLLSRNFCQKCVTKNSRNIVTLLQKFTLTEKIFRQMTLVISFTCFHEIILKWYKNFVNSTLHSVEKREIYSHRKNISSNQLFRDFFSKCVAFTKFLPYRSESTVW